MFPARAVTAGLARWMHWHNALLHHDAMRRAALIDSSLAHGTALVRRAWLARVGGWRERGWAEDLDLWLRLFEAGARFAKLPVTLYGWRQHQGSSTWRDPRYARERFLALKLAALQRGPQRGARRRRPEPCGVGTHAASGRDRAARARACQTLTAFAPAGTPERVSHSLRADLRRRIRAGAVARRPHILRYDGRNEFCIRGLSRYPHVDAYQACVKDAYGH